MIQLNDNKTFTILNLGHPDHKCKSACCRVYTKWVSWFRRTFKNREQIIDGQMYSVPQIPLAVLLTGYSEDEYLKNISYASWNAIKNAKLNNYIVSIFNSADYLDDIYSIRKSQYQSKDNQIPSSYQTLPKPFDITNSQLCKKHYITGIGVFKDNTLVAYAAVHNSGDLAIINTISGHTDHLKFGIMSLLVFGIYREMKNHFPDVKFINFLTLSSSNQSLNTFKKSLGFINIEFGLPLLSPTDSQLSCIPQISTDAKYKQDLRNSIIKLSSNNNSSTNDNVAISFKDLLSNIKCRQFHYYKCGDLPSLSPSAKGVSFRYDIHLRDIPNAYIFAREHVSKCIPATFFLHIGYSKNELDCLLAYVDLANYIKAAGLELGFHTSPVDSYFIWNHHKGNAGAYWTWLHDHGKNYISELASNPQKLITLNSLVEQHFCLLSEYAKKILGSFDLIAAHGGEMTQCMRPLISTFSPEECEVFNSLRAGRWMTFNRLNTVGATADVEQFQSEKLKQVSDYGKGYSGINMNFNNITDESNVQFLIHPYGWQGNASVSKLKSTINKYTSDPKNNFLDKTKSLIDMQSENSKVNARIKQESNSSMNNSNKIQTEVDTPLFTVIQLGTPDVNCTSACVKFYEKWTSWFCRTFKNTEKIIDGIHFSVPQIPLAVIKTSQTEDEYLKLIGDKSRNMLRKATKNGYTVSVFNSADYLDDIYAIRTSKKIRSGKPVPKSWAERPVPFDTSNSQLCKKHQITGIGVFKDNTTLVAYAVLHNCGDLAIINTILGHGDHLKFGIMNLLVFGMYREIKANFPDVKYINYLTLRSSTRQLDTFKKSVGFIPLEFGLPLLAQKESMTQNIINISSSVNVTKKSTNPIAELIENKSFRKILIRGDCCSIRTVTRNPQLFGHPLIIHNEKATTQVYLDHLDGISYPDDELFSICNLDAMSPSLRRYFINQNKADFLYETGADLLVMDSYADSVFQLWENKKSKAKIWVNRKYLRDKSLFEKQHRLLPRKSFNEVLIDTQKIIEHVRGNNPDIPVLYLTHPIHYYHALNSRREFCYLGQELERFTTNVYWGTHLLKSECEPVDMDSCGPGETHHYTPETYAKMVLAAASRNPHREVK